MFRIVTILPGKMINTYLKNDHRLISVLLPRYRDCDSLKLKKFLASSSPGDSLEMRNRAGKDTTITRIR